MKTELKFARERATAIRARDTLVQDEAKRLDREKELLQCDAKQKEREIQLMKRMQSLQEQSLNEAKQEKKDFQSLIARKEEELKVAYKTLEGKEKELQENRMEMERVRRRLEEAEREVAERNGRIMELERERAELCAEIQSERKTKDELLQKAFFLHFNSCTVSLALIYKHACAHMTTNIHIGGPMGFNHNHTSVVVVTICKPIYIHILIHFNASQQCVHVCYHCSIYVNSGRVLAYRDKHTTLCNQYSHTNILFVPSCLLHRNYI